jgi:hypothetical protein
MRVLMGVCPCCQTEVEVDKTGKYCLPHNLCNKDEGMPLCDGSFNTAPEVEVITTKCLATEMREKYGPLHY